MSLIFTPKRTTTISDHKGNKIFEYPGDTLLDIIISDLWNDIIKYVLYPPFMICNIKETIPFYRKITKDEFETIKNKLIDYHRKNNGIPMTINQFQYNDPNNLRIIIKIDENCWLAGKNYPMPVFGLIHGSHNLNMLIYKGNSVIQNSIGVCIRELKCSMNNDGNSVMLMIFDPHN